MSIDDLSVCILSAGIGSRIGCTSSFINKGLLPVDNKPCIVHLIDRIPEKNDIVIAVGHLGSDLEFIINKLRPNRKIKFVYIDKFEQKNPGRSLFECMDFLSKSFIVFPNDGLYENLDTYFLKEKSFFIDIGISKDMPGDYLRIGKKFYREKKDKIDGHSYIYNGLMYVSDRDKFIIDLGPSWDSELYNNFQKYLDNNEISFSNIEWEDIGTEENYKNVIKKYSKYDFSKKNEITCISNKVFKIFYDADVSQKKVNKANHNVKIYPKCQIIPSKKGFLYDFVKGQTLYRKCDDNIFHELLTFLKKNLWSNLGSVEISCLHEFYIEKSKNRLSKLFNKYSFLNGCFTVNNCKTHISDDIFQKIMKFDSVLSDIHGDLQFDNIVYEKKFTLIDWRHEFCNDSMHGDLYYDIAKLLGGILIDYSRIKNNDFFAELKDDNISYDPCSVANKDSYIAILKSFHLENDLSWEKTQNLVKAIYLNMAPLHSYPFDIFLVGQALDLKVNEN